MDVVLKNIREMKFNLTEFSGGFGDLGTFIPLTVAMALVTGMDIGLILIWAGIFHITAGIAFGLPVPIQPMKAIAAVAIAEKLLPEEIAAAGIIIGLILLFLSLTNLIKVVEEYIPRAVIRGIQLGVGLKLAIKGCEYIAGTSMWGWDSIVLSVSLGILIILLRKNNRFPSALILFSVGTIIMIYLYSGNFSDLNLTLSLPVFILPDTSAWLTGLLKGALPQLPLTLLNSVLAICALSGDLFPNREISTRKMSLSVGLMNLTSCWFGGMPVCHGSGGLAGQYHFGARTGGSMVMQGVGKLLIGLFFGTAAMQLLYFYPYSIMGIMLIFAGIELALPARDQLKKDKFFIVIVTTIGIVAINAAVGFIMGMIVYWLFSFKKNK